MRYLFIADTHCPAMRRGYISFLCRVRDAWACERVVHVGDLVNWAAISFHERNPSLSSAYDEYKKAKKQVHKLVAEFPKVDWLLGNHDVNVQRVARAAGIPEELLRSYHDIWELPKTWRVHPRFASLQINANTIVTHGESGKGGMYAAHKQCQQHFCNVICGHYHTEAGVWYTANERALVWGMSVGFGGDWKKLEFEYGRKFTKKPIVGCGVLVDGVPIFEPMPL